MNLRHLRYFVEIAASGSLRRASEGLYVTQSALSRAVAELESELGCALLERNKHGVVPTRQGAQLVHKARRLLQDADSIRAELQDAVDDPTGHVRLAIPIGVRDHMTRPVLRRMRTRYPRIRIDMIDGTAHENRSAVQEGRADIAVIHESDKGLPLGFRRLYFDPLYLVAPLSLGLHPARPVDPVMLAEVPLLQIHSPNEIRWTVDTALRRLGRRANLVMEVSSSPLILDLVEDGHGCAVLPRTLIDSALQQRRVCAAPVGTLRVTWVAAWSKNRPLPRAVQLTLDALFETVKASRPRMRVRIPR